MKLVRLSLCCTIQRCITSFILICDNLFASDVHCQGEEWFPVESAGFCNHHHPTFRWEKFIKRFINGHWKLERQRHNRVKPVFWCNTPSQVHQSISSMIFYFFKWNFKALCCSVSPSNIQDAHLEAQESLQKNQNKIQPVSIHTKSKRLSQNGKDCKEPVMRTDQPVSSCIKSGF